jgi:hypothetical protein
MNRFASTGLTTPPTQWTTCLLVTLRIGLGVVLAGGGAVADGDQLLLEGLDHRGDRGGGLGEGGFQPLALLGGRVAGAGLLQALADFGADQGWVSEQAGDVVPHDGVGVVGADWLAGADPATGGAPQASARGSADSAAARSRSACGLRATASTAAAICAAGSGRAAAATCEMT